LKPQLDVGATLREVFQIYRDQAGVLLPVAFWLFLGVVAAGALAVLAGGGLPLALISIVVTIVVLTLYEGVVVGLVRDLRDGTSDPSVGRLFRSVMPVLLRLIVAGILLVLGLALGFCMFVVPGLILLTIWAVIAPVIVVERTGVLAAFGRSYDLVEGNGWRVFAVSVVAILIAFAASVALSALGEAVANGPIVRAVFGALASTVTAPIEGLAAAVLYFRLLAIERSAAPAAAPNPPQPAI
jgi:hypothetical protein